ncbi:hypothetical protein JW707_03235 [Candidatus Woesearchaeota archaeon]|nr:hypothetical protein [Candidatus Woesearchaeota archaeon]
MPKIKHRYTDFNKEYLEAAKFKLKHKDYFSWKYLYMLMHEWLVEEGYAPREDEDFPEEFYMHREHQKSGTEVWVYWRMTKNPVPNPFWRYDLDLDVHIVLMRDTEIMFQGKKYKVNWGEPEIKIWAKCVADYSRSWKGPIMGKLRQIFFKRIIKRDFEMHKKELYREAYRLQEAIKTYFKLSTYLPEIEGQKFYETKPVP